jgi:transcriptional regulator with XRE-family HTH domain
MTNDKEQLKEFGIWFSKLRVASGYSSQRQLALTSNVSTTTVSRIESGNQKAEPETLAKLAPFLKVSFSEVMIKAGYPVTDTGEIEQKKPKDLQKFLDNQEIMFDGVPLTEDDKGKIRKALEIIFWDAKQQNKRKKS